jgi:hydroxylysine kinase
MALLRCSIQARSHSPGAPKPPKIAPQPHRCRVRVTETMAVGNLDAFLATMVASPIAVSVQEAEELARDRYGLDATATRLTGERDENFRLACADGTQYVLKIANAAEEPAVTDLPTAALLHVERVDPGFPCPRVLRNLEGGTQSRYNDESGRKRAARVLTYLPGKTLRSSVRSREQRMACGRLAARLGLALRDFTHPAARRPLIWDLRNVGKALALLSELPDLVEKNTIAALIERIEMLLAIRFQRLRQQVIHNDLNDMNLLVDPLDEAVVVGVIDFGDLVHTALIADVAIVATDQITAGSTARDSIADIVTAYHEVTPLLPPELVLLNPLIAGRILTDILIASWHRHRNPTGTHYSDLDPAFVRARVQLATDLLSTELPL